VAAPAAWGQPAPDVFERTVAQTLDEGQTSSTTSMLDARERALATKQTVQPTSALDARERALTEKREVQLGSGVYPDVFERAVAARGSTVDQFIANDNRFRIDPSSNPVPVTVTSSGREIEWPQVGIGLGVGIALILGLLLALRATRHRPLAH
jgi:hypothetical protein